MYTYPSVQKHLHVERNSLYYFAVGCPFGHLPPHSDCAVFLNKYKFRLGKTKDISRTYEH